MNTFGINIKGTLFAHLFDDDATAISLINTLKVNWHHFDDILRLTLSDSRQLQLLLKAKDKQGNTS